MCHVTIKQGPGRIMFEILHAVEASIVILYFSSHLTFLSYSFGLEKALSALEDCRTVH